MTIQQCSLLRILNTLTKFFQTNQLQNLTKVFSKEIDLANHQLHRHHKKFHSLTICRFLCTNTLNESSIFRVTVIVVFELFQFCSVKGEDNHTLILHQLVHELRTHKESYTRLYRKKENSKSIYESLVDGLSPSARKYQL